MPTDLTCNIDEEEQYHGEQAHMEALEREIDLMVYGVYGVTEEEIGVVENKGER